MKAGGRRRGNQCVALCRGAGGRYGGSMTGQRICMSSLLMHGKRWGVAARVRGGGAQKHQKRLALKDGIRTIVVTPTTQGQGPTKLAGGLCSRRHRRGNVAAAAWSLHKTGKGFLGLGCGCAHTQAAHAGARAGKGREEKKGGKATERKAEREQASGGGGGGYV